jgi:tetratricopeptide (TPR) repeat protein
MVVERQPPYLNVNVWSYAVISIFILCMSPAVADPIAWSRLEDPHIRAAQFDALMGDPFAGLTQLMADQKQGRVTHRPGQAQMVLGGMYLAYGSYDKAAEIFDTLGKSDQPVEIRDLAWYYLAHVQYQHGRREQALESLKRITGELPVKAQQGRLLLTAILLMDRHQYDEAIGYLRQLGKKSLVQQLSEKSVWATYGRFNLGVALYQDGKEKEGRQLLEELGSQTASDDESLALRDKANLTLGFKFLQKGKPDDAQKYFVKTRLQGPLSNKALLGLGRVYSAQEKHKKSLVPWLKLIKRDASDPSVQDALLAVPFAFGKLNAYKQALDYYKQALETYKQELEQVKKAAATVNSGALVESLARIVGEQELDERGFLSKLPDTPGGHYLWQLFATNKFQESLKNFARMRMSLGRMEQWSSEISSDTEMSDKQKRTMHLRVAKLEFRLVDLVAELKKHLKDMALKELDKRRERLVSYAGEARFSMAQIYDYAAKRWGEGG